MTEPTPDYLAKLKAAVLDIATVPATGYAVAQYVVTLSNNLQYDVQLLPGDFIGVPLMPTGPDLVIYLLAKAMLDNGLEIPEPKKPTFLEVEREYQAAIAGLERVLLGEAEETAGDDIYRYIQASRAYVLALREHKKILTDLVWEQHALWMSSFIPVAQAQGLSADDFYKVMSQDDRDKNRAFLDAMHPITNPHLEGT